MGITEQTPASSNGDAPAGDVTSPAHAGRGDAVHVEEVELAVTRAAHALRHALSADEQARAQLLEMLQHLSALQARLGEWQELHHALHALRAAFAPFRATLRALGSAPAGPASGQALLRSWRPCQTEVDRLTDLESRVEHIQLTRDREGRAAPRPDWGARIASLRREMEDRLREEEWSTAGLIDLADEFNHACECYLSLASRELRRAVERAQRVYTHLLGGLS
jgi:hypothetical protein